MAAPNTTIEFAGRRVELAAPAVVEAFFATITYRLEPQGRGTRFPVVIMGLYGGHLSPQEMPAAVAELDVIAAELRTLAPGKAIGNLGNLTPFRALPPLVNDSAASLFDYFITLTGTPLVAALRSAIDQSRTAELPLTFQSPQVVKDRNASIWAIVGGAAWSLIGYFYFPNFVIVPLGAGPLTGGPLIWPIGLPFLGVGILALLGFRGSVRTFKRGGDSHVGVTLIALAAVVLWLFATWRS